jgi:LytS/YehU family sensor histidine kinase
MRTDPATADRMLVKLSQLLRLSLEQSREQETTLGRELAFLEGYLEVEHMRLGGRLRVVFEIPESLLDAQVPAFVLQPLLETAIQHGISERGQGATIHIRAREEGGMLTMEVQDDCQRPGQSAGAGDPAPRDARLCLEQAYGKGHGLDLRYLEGGGAVARIRLPLSLHGGSPRFLGPALPA